MPIYLLVPTYCTLYAERERERERKEILCGTVDTYMHVESDRERKKEKKRSFWNYCMQFKI